VNEGTLCDISLFAIKVEGRCVGGLQQSILFVTRQCLCALDLTASCFTYSDFEVVYLTMLRALQENENGNYHPHQHQITELN
jgi:hypothetical protein